MKASEVRYLVDAGPLIGAFWSRDQWHTWSRECLRNLGRMHTTEAVLAEAAHRLKPCTPALLQLLAAVDAGLISLIPVFPTYLGRAAQLISDYSTRCDLCDASLIILSEQWPRAKLVTVDTKDFTVYRRKDGCPVPAIMPGSAGA